jgi:S1-C subfamily serine protease
VQVSFSGNDRIRARVVGFDPSTDIAVLQVDAQARALTPLPLGDSDVLSVGDAVVAIGNPLGLDRTVTAGIVSALQREIQAPNGFTIDHVIQTDAAINEGNSGGPLLSSSGEVVGLNSQFAVTRGGNQGIGFAVPINTVRQVVSQIIVSGRVEHAWLGAELQTIDAKLASTFRLAADSGVLVAHVEPGSPADRGRLHGGTNSVVVDGETYRLGGDIIVRANGRIVASADQLRAIVTSLKPGSTLTLQLAGTNGPRIATIKLGRQPTTPAG